MDVGNTIDLSKDIVNPDTSGVDPSVNDGNTTQSDDTTQATSDEFASFFRSALGEGQVSEEEIFSSLIERRLGEHSPEAQEFFNDQRSELLVSMARSDGYVSVEDVAVAALTATVEEGLIDQETAEKINGESFAAAQLDENKDALYDAFGSAEDPTIAVAEMESALFSMREMLDKIESGELEVAARALDVDSNSVTDASGDADSTDVTGATDTDAAGGSSDVETKPLDGSGGFLWKPESEADGNLVVLLPDVLKGMIANVQIHNSLPPDESTKIAEGRFAGDTHNGGRPHYRFDEPGSAYGSDIYLVVNKTDGTSESYSIGNGGERHD